MGRSISLIFRALVTAASVAAGEAALPAGEPRAEAIRGLMQSPNSDAACHILVDRGWRPLAPLEVAAAMEDAILERAPTSKAAVIIHLNRIGELLNTGEIGRASESFDRLDLRGMPLYIQGQALECEGDIRLSSDDSKGACDRYLKAAGRLCVEGLIGPCSFFTLKARPPTAGGAPEEHQAAAKCLKAYLLLARGETAQAAAALKALLVELDGAPGGMPAKIERQVDAHYLLCLARHQDGAEAEAVEQGMAAIRIARSLKAPEDRPSLLALSALLLRMREGRPAARTSGAPTMDALTERDLFAAVNARKIGRDDLVRTHCANLLKEGDGAESSAFLDACDMVVRGFAGGRTGPGGGAWRSPYAEWLERVLFPDRRDIKELALARAEYLLGNLAGAGDHAEACLASAARPYPISRAWLLKGRIRLREGDLAGALPCFSEVLRWAGPEDHAGAEALFLAGYAYLMDGDLARADEAFGSLEARYPAGRFSAKAAALRAGIEQSMGMIVPETLPLAVESGGS